MNNDGRTREKLKYRICAKLVRDRKKKTFKMEIKTKIDIKIHV